MLRQRRGGRLDAPMRECDGGQETVVITLKWGRGRGVSPPQRIQSPVTKKLWSIEIYQVTCHEIKRLLNPLKQPSSSSLEITINNQCSARVCRSTIAKKPDRASDSPAP